MLLKPLLTATPEVLPAVLLEAIKVFLEVSINGTSGSVNNISGYVGSVSGNVDSFGENLDKTVHVCTERVPALL